MKLQLLGFVAALLLASPALHAWERQIRARPLAPRSVRRFVRPVVRISQLARGQQFLIRREFRQGDLTRQELRRLELEQARIRWHRARAAADGRLTFNERRRLANEYRRARRHIHHAGRD